MTCWTVSQTTRFKAAMNEPNKKSKAARKANAKIDAAHGDVNEQIREAEEDAQARRMEHLVQNIRIVMLCRSPSA